MAAYLLHLLTLVAITVVLATSLNLALGVAGLLNLGHVAFFGIGAYTSALLTLSGIPFPVAFVLAGGAAALAGAGLMLLTRRLAGEYLALATLGFSFVVYSIFLNWTALTRGPLGIPGIPRPDLFGIPVRSAPAFLLLALVVAVLSVVLLHRITVSRYGRVLGAIRDDERGAQALGKPTARLKVQALAVSAFFAGLAGSLFAHFLTFIDPGSFFLSEIILLLTIVLVGGLASLRGSVVASALIVLLPEFLRFVALPSSVLGPARQVLYALLVLIVLRVRPRGLFGTVDLR